MHPRAVLFPGQRAARGTAARHARETLPPPLRLAHEPRKSAARRVARLPREAEKRDGKPLRRGATHQNAPQFVPRVALMGAHLVALHAGKVMPDRERSLVPRLPSVGAAAEREIGFFISVPEKTGIAAELRKHSAADGCAGVGVGACEMRRSEICLWQRRRKFVGALWKTMQWRARDFPRTSARLAE